MSTRSCLCRRSLVAALAVLIFAPSVPALGSAPVRVVLQSARIELEDEDPVVGVVVRDRREGDPALLGELLSLLSGTDRRRGELTAEIEALSREGLVTIRRTAIYEVHLIGEDASPATR